MSSLNLFTMVDQMPAEKEKPWKWLVVTIALEIAWLLLCLIVLGKNLTLYKITASAGMALIGLLRVASGFYKGIWCFFPDFEPNLRKVLTLLLLLHPGNQIADAFEFNIMQKGLVIVAGAVVAYIIWIFAYRKGNAVGPK